MAFLDPGELRQELTVEKDTITRNDAGTVTHAWAAQPPDPVRAKIEELTGQEYVEAQALAAGAKLRVTMRFFSGLEPTLYRFKGVRYGASRTWNILHVNNVEQRDVMMIVLCGEDPS